jgi:cbb3-type cytochrome oxidase subunit 3
MISFIKHYFDSIEGIGFFPTIITVFFFLLFIIMIGLVLIMKKKYIDENSRLPLEDDENL